jgi:hypothetical protein
MPTETHRVQDGGSTTTLKRTTPQEVGAFSQAGTSASVTDVQNNDLESTTRAKLGAWRRAGGVPPEAFGASKQVWGEMTGEERVVWSDAWGTPRCMRRSDPSNPGGSVGGSYRGIR